MHSTEHQDRARQLAAALFDQVVAPLAAARAAAGNKTYFPMAAEQGVRSYYVDPMPQPADFAFPGGGTADGLIDALVAHWTAQGETALASMGPQLKQIATALEEQAVESDGSVNAFVYTMF
jgi:hypothetical protein